jgi:hypothetical protein
MEKVVMGLFLRHCASGCNLIDKLVCQVSIVSWWLSLFLSC